MSDDEKYFELARAASESFMGYVTARRFDLEPPAMSDGEARWALVAAAAFFLAAMVEVADLHGISVDEAMQTFALNMAASLAPGAPS